MNSSLDNGLYNRFIALRPKDCFEALEIANLPRVRGVKFESPENRVFQFGQYVLKFYRPGRWSREALEEEILFLEDLRAADVPFCRPVGGVHEWNGIFFIVFEAVLEPFKTDPEVLTLDQLKSMVNLIARLHEVGAARPAEHRPFFDVRDTCELSLESILECGYMPRNLKPRYSKAISEISELCDAMGPFPQQRVHGDSYSGNALWRADGPIFLDLDDFQMGPKAIDIPLMSYPWRLESLDPEMPRKERRVIQHKLVLELYRDVSDFDEVMEALIPIARAYRNIVFDAWMSSRWNEPGFNENYEDDDLLSEGWWVSSIEFVEQMIEHHLQGWG